MVRLFLRLGSSRVRLAVGLVLACLLLTQIISAFDGASEVIATQEVLAGFDGGGELTAAPESEAQIIERLARTDHIALLRLCLERYHSRVKDYTCTLVKQERLGGKMSKEQVIDIRFKEDPFSVLMTWRVNPGRGDKMLYVETPGRTADQWKMYIRPTGMDWLIRSVERSPDDAEVRNSSLRSITEFGFARGLESLIAVYEKAKAAGHLIETSYLGTRELDGRPTFALKRVLPPGHGYPAQTTVIEIDQEYLVPVRITGTVWPADEPLCSYRYTDIKFNTGLTDGDFTRKANGL